MRARADELIRKEPSQCEGYFWRGYCEIQSHRYYDAVRFLRRAAALNPNSYVLRVLAFSYYFLGQFRLFTLSMNQAAQQQPADFAPYYYLGRHYVSTAAGEFGRAAEYFKAALDRNPSHYCASHKFRSH